MVPSKKSLRTCDKGHKYYKSSDCPTCPICEQERKPESGFLSLLSAPARRALEHNGITSLQQLSNYSEKEILQFTGWDPLLYQNLGLLCRQMGYHSKKNRQLYDNCLFLLISNGNFLTPIADDPKSLAATLLFSLFFPEGDLLRKIGVQCFRYRTLLAGR